MADRFKQKANIQIVKDEPELWDGKDGYKGASAVAILDTGESCSYSSTPKWVDGHIAALKKLIGQEVELELEDKGTYGYKIVDYPGKPTGSGGGGGRGNPALYAAQTALLAAAQAGVEPNTAIHIAENFYLPWLKKQAGLATSGGSSAPAQSDPGPDKTDGGVQPETANLRQIRALRSLAEANGWSEEEACEKAGVSALGEVLSKNVPVLLSEWGSV